MRAGVSVQRPNAAPADGVVPAFDAGWYAHEVGLDRETVIVLAADRDWALLGWDSRQLALSPEGQPHSDELKTEAEREAWLDRNLRSPEGQT